MEVKRNNSEKLVTDIVTFRLSEDFMLIYSFVCFSGLCQAINIFGIGTNMINIFCFVKQGFQDSVNISLLGLTISDLGSLTTMSIGCVLITPTLVSADLPIEPMSVHYMTSAMLHLSFTRVSGCLTAIITVERCLCITVPLQVKGIITPKRTTVVMVSVFIIFFLSGAPVYAVNSLGMKFSPSRNATILGLISTGDREQVEKITFTINSFSIPLINFMIIVVCTAILSVKLRDTTEWREKTITSSQVDRVSARNQKTAKMVVMISTLFIVCFVPMCVTILLLGLLPDLSVGGKYFHISTLVGGVVCVLESVNASMNIFVYYHMSSNYRTVLFKYMCWTTRSNSKTQSRN